MALPESPDNTVTPALRATQGKTALEAKMDLRVKEAHRERPVLKGIEDRKVILAPKVQSGLRDRPEW